MSLRTSKKPLKRAVNLSRLRHFLFNVLFLCVGLASDSLAASSGDYDRYTSEMAYATNDSSLKRIALEFPSYPFELIRWPVDKTLVFLEEERIPAKTLYVYETLSDRGVKPKIGFASQGVEFDIPKALRLKRFVPSDLIAKTWISYGHERILETGAKIGYGSEDAGFHTYGAYQYERRPNEKFYGLGPDTSKGDGTTFKMVTNKIEAVAGYTQQGHYRFDTRAAFRNIDIENGEDSSTNFFLHDYNQRSVPGMGGDKIVTVGTDFWWIPFPDQDLVSPGKARLSADFNEGLNESDARYFKFTGDAFKNIKLGTDRRILALRFYGEHNNHAKNRETPFHQKAKLGGFGGFPRLSQTLRSFDDNRFIDDNAMLFNIEYRYRVYDNRNWRVTQVFFFDDGQVFQTLGKFQFSNFRESYGGGFRLDYLQHALLDIEMAFGEEGAAFHLRTRRPF
jgi:hypothetical protein